MQIKCILPNVSTRDNMENDSTGLGTYNITQFLYKLLICQNCITTEIKKKGQHYKNIVSSATWKDRLGTVD